MSITLSWTQDMDPAFLVAAIAITSYCIIGSRLEERKLLVYHGEVYRRYRERVPALLPLPWKKLSKEAAQELLSRHLPK